MTTALSTGNLGNSYWYHIYLTPRLDLIKYQTISLQQIFIDAWYISAYMYLKPNTPNYKNSYFLHLIRVAQAGD